MTHIYAYRLNTSLYFLYPFWLRSLFSDASKIWLLPHLLRQTSAVWDSEPRANGAVWDEWRACSSAGFAGKSWGFCCRRFQRSLEDWNYWHLLNGSKWPKRLAMLWLSLDVDLGSEGGGARTWVDIGDQTHSTTTFFSGMPMAEQTSFTHLSSWLSISQSLIMLPQSILRDSPTLSRAHN